MADLSRDDVTRAVRDGLNDLKNDLNTIRDSVNRIDQRTNDLDRSQEEIKRIADLVPRLENMTNGDKLDRTVNEVTALKSQIGDMTQYLQQIAKYLEALNQRAQQDGQGENWRK